MTQKNAKRTKRKQTSKKKNNKIIIVSIILLLIVILIINSKNTIKTLNYEETQIILNNENITEKLQDNIIIENGKIYMSVQDIQTFIDETVYQEQETGLIITTGNKKIAALKQNDENITINGSNQQIKDVIIETNEQKYIAISELENVYDYDFDYVQNSNIVTIDYLDKELIKAYAKKNIKIKKENKIFSDSIDEVQKGNWVIYISEEKGMAKIRTQNGIIGYVKRNILDNLITERDNFDEEQNNAEKQETMEYDISKKDISTFAKRLDIINLILQETIKNDKMHVQIIYDGTEASNLERFKIESVPILKECGITVQF